MLNKVLSGHLSPTQKIITCSERMVGEGFAPIASLLKQFELIYVVGPNGL
jgi:hypothetical protein